MPVNAAGQCNAERFPGEGAQMHVEGDGNAEVDLVGGTAVGEGSAWC